MPLEPGSRAQLKLQGNLNPTHPGGWGSFAIKNQGILIISNQGAVLPPPPPPQYDTLIWYDASDASTIITDVGNNVLTWNDKGPYGNHLTQSTPADRPTYNTRTHNGLNVVNFGTEGQFVEKINLVLPESNMAWYIVCQIDPGGVNSNTDSIISFYRTVEDDDSWQLISWNGSEFRGSYTRSIPDRQRLFYGNTNLIGEYQMFEVMVDNTHLIDSIYLNGTFKGQVADRSIMNLNESEIRLFSNRTEIAFPVGAMAEVLCVNSVQVDARQKVEGCLAWKWGIQSKLPIDHPYKNSPPTACT